MQMHSLASLIALLASPVAAQDAEPHHLVLAGAGRFAVFADLTSVQPDGNGIRMRAFQVAEEDFEVAGQAYWGGWSWWRFDCENRMADRLDFAAVKAGGAEGPATPDPAPAYDAAPGGDAAELLEMACRPPVPWRDGHETLEAAVRAGRAALAE